MPRSPAEGAATRAGTDLEIPKTVPTRDRRVRSGVDRRQTNAGPPNGVERRRNDRRSHDRRSGSRADRRARDRRSSASRRGVTGGPRHIPRVASREHGPLITPRSRTPNLLRAIIIMLVAVACLLAATLTGPVDQAGAAAPKKKTGTVKAVSGGVTATLSYVRQDSGKLKVYGKLRLTVKADGRKTLRKVKPRGGADEAWVVKPSLKLADVTGDGIVDPIVETYTGGAHCCTLSAIAPSTASGWGKPVTRNWADYGFKLEDLGGTSQVEFKAYDQRFTGAYSSYAASRSPLQIFRFQGGSYVDVTREFPDWIKLDATDRAKDWQDAGNEEQEYRAELGRSAAAAWIADLALLGDYEAARAVVKASSDRGDFAGTGSAFPGQLGHDLKAWGYLPDPALVGLTDDPIAA